MRVEDYIKKINGKVSEATNKTSYRNSIIRRTLITAVIVLTVMIICNLSTKAKNLLNKYIYETNYNFAKINSLYKKYLLDISKKTGLDTKPKPVSGNSLIEYTNYEDYKDGVKLTVSDKYNVKLLESGLVVFIGEKEGYGNSIIIQQSNGIDVLYGNIETNDLKIYDYIEKGNIIGTSNKELYLVFTKDGENLDYKTYIK